MAPKADNFSEDCIIARNAAWERNMDGNPKGDQQVAREAKGELKKRGLLEIEWAILGVKAVKTPMDMGFCVLGAALKFGIMSEVGIRQETASSVGRVFVRGLSSLRERSWRIR